MNITEFQRIISETGKPVIVDFWATWCVPCRLTKPILEKLAIEYADEVEFVPVDADAARETLERYKVLGIPTVLVLRNGIEIGRVTGARNEAGYRTLFESLSEGGNVKIPVSTFERMLRLGAGMLIGIVGVSTSNLFVTGVGGVIAFLGIYDRCPVWAALTGMLRSYRKAR